MKNYKKPTFISNEQVAFESVTANSGEELADTCPRGLQHPVLADPRCLFCKYHYTEGTLFNKKARCEIRKTFD